MYNLIDTYNYFVYSAYSRGPLEELMLAFYEEDLYEWYLTILNTSNGKDMSFAEIVSEAEERVRSDYENDAYILQETILICD